SFPGVLLDCLQLGQRERDGPLVPLVQLQPVGKLRGNLGHDLPLGLGEPDRDVLLGAWHRVTPGAWSLASTRSTKSRLTRNCDDGLVICLLLMLWCLCLRLAALDP